MAYCRQRGLVVGLTGLPALKLFEDSDVAIEFLLKALGEGPIIVHDTMIRIKDFGTRYTVGLYYTTP